MHSSVLPTPVGPKNKNEPLGRWGSASPARALRTAWETAVTASPCPTTRACNVSSMRSNFSRSPSNIFATGIPVHRDTTSATSSSVTRERNSVGSGCASSAWANRRSRSGSTPCCSSDIRVRSPARLACSRSSFACSISLLTWAVLCNAAFSANQTSSRLTNSRSTSSICWSSWASSLLAAAVSSFFTASRSILSWIRRRSSLSITSGFESISIRIRLAASSTRSIALSGN